MRRGEQAIHDLLISLTPASARNASSSSTVGGSPVKSSETRRSSFSFDAGGDGSRPSRSRRARTNESISFRGQAASRTDGNSARTASHTPSVPRSSRLRGSSDGASRSWRAKAVSWSPAGITSSGRSRGCAGRGRCVPRRQARSPPLGIQARDARRPRIKRSPALRASRPAHGRRNNARTGSGARRIRETGSAAEIIVQPLRRMTRNR
jgi:hypothetical protein